MLPAVQVQFWKEKQLVTEVCACKCNYVCVGAVNIAIGIKMFYGVLVKGRECQKVGRMVGCNVFRKIVSHSQNPCYFIFLI